MPTGGISPSTQKELCNLTRLESCLPLFSEHSGIIYPKPFLQGAGQVANAECGTVLVLLFSCQSCPALHDLMDCSTPGFSVPHHLPEFAQVHVHWIDHTTQPSHPLSPSSPSAFNLFQHQGLFQWVSCSCQQSLCLFASHVWVFSRIWPDWLSQWHAIQ